ncbi:nuclease-related domain-containing protein [Macrococcoides caseolyticum]|uniref:nuclease-related domain-containing protein n=1 Tax=Macrococcoides caseolyticum TaxID=69966 RepID=UPI001F4239B2|nr:nuclease-related domain-containing protein [Macrococcus caseolyticus]MCE4955981.1 NERD domain-containing protein [Macrococcus caseolyticus]
MIVKAHNPSQYISYLLEVDQRIYLIKKDYLALSHYRKGLEGELKFLHVIKDIENVIILWDIRIEMPGEIQYDFIIITQDTVFHFDVKNFSGRYNYEDGIFMSENGYVEKDLMSSLKKAHKKMEKLIIDNKFGFKMVSKIIFINDTLDLCNFPGSGDVMFYFDIHKIVAHLQRYKHIDSEMQRLAKLLIDLHKNNSEHEVIHYYDFNQMKPGVKCKACGRIGMKHYRKSRFFKCICGYKERNSEVLERTYNAISLIEKGLVNTSKMVSWTKLSDRTLRYFLGRRYKKIGSARATYYFDNEYY